MRRALAWTPPLAVFAFSVVYALIRGRDGCMPLDQCIVFDGAWRALHGEVPYRDYFTPNGLTPIYLQACFFAVLGPTWFAYVLHAALANGVFAWVSWWILRRLGLSRAPAAIFALATGVIFYPPFGVPYLEQHGFLFSLLGIAAALAACASPAGSRREAAFWFAVPVAFTAAWFSKQIPSAFALPLALAIWLSAGRARFVRGSRWMSIGTTAVLAIVLVACCSSHLDLRVAWTYHVRLPAAEGATKQHYVSSLAKLTDKAAATVVELALGSLWIVVVAAVPLVLGAGLALARRARLADRSALGAGLLGVGLVAVCLLFTSFTGNQTQNGVPFVFLALGLVAAAIERLATARGRASARAAVGLSLALALVAAADAWRFDRDVVRTRMVDDLTFDAELAHARAKDLPAELAFLRWSTPEHYAIGARDVADVASFLRASPDGFVLLGDLSLLNALARKPSLAPSLWMHPGLTLPWPGDPAWPDWQRRLVAPFIDGRARWLVLEGEATWTHRRLADFDELARLVHEHGKFVRRFGFFRVIDLGAAKAVR